MAAKRTKRRPTKDPDGPDLRAAAPPGNTGSERPIFCFRYLRPGFRISDLDEKGQAALARTLEERAQLTWNQLTTASRHGQGLEHIRCNALTVPVPEPFDGEEKATVFRYDGKKPMAGFRVGAVFHVLWIEREYGHLYDHG